MHLSKGFKPVFYLSDKQKVMETFEKVEESILQEALKAGALIRARTSNAAERDFKDGSKLVGKDGLIQSTF